MKLIKSVKNLKGKIVLLRSDLNVESDKDALKLQEAVPTIKHLIKNKAITIVMSHRGRPKHIDPKLSLTFALPFFKKYVSKDTRFLPAFNFSSIREELRDAKPGSVFLLENVRFHPGEDKEDEAFSYDLASLGDIYVYDAFASWRPGASVTVLPKLLPAYAGLLVEKEVKHLSKVMNNPKSPLVVIMGGGAKAIDKFDVIRHLHTKASAFLLGGIIANTFLKAKGVDINGSIIEPALIEPVKDFLHDKKIYLPHDWISDREGKIGDLGPLSAASYQEVIKTAGTVIWNGPMGIFEDKRYRAGSLAIAKAIVKSSAFSVIGGGETTQFILQSKLANKIDFLSTGGGAMLAYLAGKKMPALEALG